MAMNETQYPIINTTDVTNITTMWNLTTNFSIFTTELWTNSTKHGNNSSIPNYWNWAINLNLILAAGVLIFFLVSVLVTVCCFCCLKSDSEQSKTKQPNGSSTTKRKSKSKRSSTNNSKIPDKALSCDSIQKDKRKVSDRNINNSSNIVRNFSVKGRPKQQNSIQQLKNSNTSVKRRRSSNSSNSSRTKDSQNEVVSSMSKYL